MPDKVYRTAIYCRLSREDGDKVESNSIASQRAICEDYIARHEDLELVCEPFVDDGYSGVSFNRPQFKKLEEAIRKGALDCIVVKDLSRFSRNYIDGGRYIEKIFPQLGIRFIAINDAYDSLTGDPQSDSFVIPFKNLINDSYCKDISMKIRSSLEVKQKSGEFVGSFAPYGYMKSPENKNQLIVDEAVSEYVQMIFSMYKDGFSIGRIAKRLNQMGVLSPMEYKHSAGVKFDTVFKTSDTAKWTYKAVQRILTNEVYIGVLAQGKRGTPNYKVRVVKSKDESEWVKVENAHEALVSYEDFMAVKVMMQRDMRCSPDQDEAHLFSGFLFCGDCQQPMIRKTVPSKTKKYIYYVCSTNKHTRTCSPHSIAAKEVEEKVFRAIHDQIELVINLEHALAMIERLPSQSRKAFNYEAQIAKIEEEIERYQKLKLGLYENFIGGVIDKSEYFEFRSSYTKIIEDKQEALLRVKKEMKQTVTTGTTERNWVTLFKQYENVEELNRRVLMSLVDRILIHENHAIEIVFKYRDEYGYIKNPDDLRFWVIDPEAADVVQRIYDMALEGYGLAEIATALGKDGIVNPTYYWRSKGVNRSGSKSTLEPTKWGHTTVKKILTLQEYCGDVINFKSYSKSYKMKRRIENPEENRAIFLNVHEPIIDRATWEKVQAMQKGTRRKKPTVTQEPSVFSGRLKCPECGGNLNFHFNQKNHDIKFFSCQNHNSGLRKCSATHYIRLDFLEQVVLYEVNRLAAFANEYERDFVKAMMDRSAKVAENDRARKQRELNALLTRDKELDMLFERLYEDNVAGKIDDTRFAMMSK